MVTVIQDRYGVAVDHVKTPDLVAGYGCNGIGLGGLDPLAIRLSWRAPGNPGRWRRRRIGRNGGFRSTLVYTGLHWSTPQNDAHALVARAAVVLGPTARALRDVTHACIVPRSCWQ